MRIRVVYLLVVFLMAFLVMFWVMGDVEPMIVKASGEKQGVEEREDTVPPLDQELVWEFFSIEQATKAILQQNLQSEIEANPALGKQIFQALFAGSITEVVRVLWTYGKEEVFGELGQLKRLMGGILLVGVCSALFVLLEELFPDNHLHHVGTYLSFLLMLAMVLVQYRQMSELAMETLRGIAQFIPIFVPTFIASIGLACGMHTAVGYQTILMGVAHIIVRLLMGIYLPLVYSHLLLSVMEGLWREERLVGAIDLLKKGVDASLKWLTRVVAGIGLVQAMLLPAMDSLQGVLLQKLASILPGLGNLSDQVFQMFLGSCVLIKNGIGIYFAVLLFLICLSPVISLFLFVLTLKGMSACIGLVGENALVKTMGRIGDSCMLLIKVVMSGVMMLFLLLSTACYVQGIR